MAQTRGYTRASALGPISGFVEDRGGRIARVFERVDLPLGILDAPDMPLPLAEQFKVLHSAGREIGDPYFGARLGRLVRIEKLSAFGRWVSLSPTLGSAIDRSNRGLNRFLQTGTRLRLVSGNGVSRWSIEFLDPGYEGRFQNELLGVSYLIDTLRCFLGRSWVPDLVRVTGTRSNQAAALEQIFCAPVLAGSAVPAIEFRTALLATARPGDGGGWQAFTSSEERIPDAAPESEVVALIGLAMLEGYPKIDWIASKLGMTRRTLQRRLGEQGLTFSELLDEQMRNRAVRLLQQQGLSVTDVAYKLGYSDPAHFSRAFAKWSGMPPRAFRGHVA
ncbi:AraC family transcriptional regulator [Algicella marina]|uniref:Helix-turn-helix domain-containing protein n=1 Tax=Algicella marina TaxID=2683284 RepID=A0A6P1T1B5_9RHOB|nr:AraC family transcriptional regulator [Algicella marina]QHQ36704.1 helix-turn-helix domain-containing protein [Algicella marina]